MNIIISNYDYLKINNNSSKEKVENIKIFILKSMFLEPLEKIECKIGETNFTFKREIFDKQNYYQYKIIKNKDIYIDGGFQKISVKLENNIIDSDEEIYFHPVNWKIIYPNSAVAKGGE